MCSTEDVDTTAELVVGIDGPSCDPCRADADLRVATTLSTRCGLIEWQTYSTCLVGVVTATRVGDGEEFVSDTRSCGSAITDWSVEPGASIVSHRPSAAEVFGESPLPPGTYAFEVEFPADLELAPATFEATIE